jgi:hypothetical protein
VEIGGVALGALVVPGLVKARPVERSAGRELLLRVEVEPALPADVLRPTVPGKAQSLVAPAGKGDEVLLERGHPKGIGHCVVVELPVRPLGAHEELAVAPEERRRDVAFPKSPSTVCSLATCMARSWCEPCQSRSCSG